jgi:glycosyltransferase involved in cell wall biosynthesis
MKISLTMIVKDGLEDLKRLKPLVEPYIDEWVVVFPPNDKAIDWAKKNGIKIVVADCTQEIEPVIRTQMASLGITVAEGHRLFNFAKARNLSLENASGDYVLWLDADDIPVGMENIRAYIEQNPDLDMINAIYDYARDEEGNSVSNHIRERIFKRTDKFKWLGGALGLIHETLLPVDGFQATQADIPQKVFYVKHNSDHIDSSSIRNHTALLYEYIKTKGSDPRTTFYLGLEYFNRRMFELSIATMLEYVKVGGSIEDRYLAWNKIGDSYNLMNKTESARNAYLESTKEMPNRPDAYLSVGETYFDEGEWVKAIEFMMTGLQKKAPETKQAVDMVKYTFRPAGYIAQAYMQLGRQKDAYEWFTKAYSMNPKHPWVNQYKDLFVEAKDLDEYVKAFVKLGQIAQRRYPKTLSKIAEIVPDELKDQELLMDFKWRFSRPKVWSTKSVVFFCSSAFEDWGPESLIKGCGGSEEAVIQLSKRLVKMGWEVTVYNNCIREGNFDGVDWVRFERFNPRDIFNVLISWRNNIFTSVNVANKKLLDLHDVPEITHYTEDLVKNCTLMVKSEYHRSLLPDLDDKQFTIVPNGIDMDQFKNPKKVKNNLVWTSSYDRGLEHLLEMWADVKKEVPDATLDVYYGFNLFDQTPWGRKPEGQAWKAKMTKLLAQDGITDHGRVGSDVVAQAYNRADVWAYPTAFPEISCITAMKAQAAKCIPVSTTYAALEETVKYGVKIKGAITDDGVKDKFKKELISLLKDEERKTTIRNQIDVSEYNWDTVAEQWHEAIK